MQPQSSAPTGIDTQSPHGGGAQAAASSDSGTQSSGRLPLRILPPQHLSLRVSASHCKPTPSRGTEQISSIHKTRNAILVKFIEMFCTLRILFCSMKAGGRTAQSHRLVVAGSAGDAGVTDKAGHRRHGKIQAVKTLFGKQCDPGRPGGSVS